MPEWEAKKRQQQMSKEYDLDRYISYSFKKDFKMNNREIEIFEPCKIMGDVFEALIGAIFIDGGIEEVLKVFQHLLAPFLLHVAKYSKKLNKEPKEDFQILSNLHKIAPDMPVAGDVFFHVNQLADLAAGHQVEPIDISALTQQLDNESAEMGMTDENSQ